MFRNFVVLAVLIGLAAGAAVELPLSPEEMRAFLCGTDASCNLDTIPGFRSALIQRMDTLMNHHLTTRDGMRDMFRYFHSDEELAHPKMKAYVNSVVESHEVYDAKISRGSGLGFTPPGKNPYPYFAFLPMLSAVVKPGVEITFAGPLCFKAITVGLVIASDNTSASLNLKLEDPRSETCSENFLFATTNIIKLDGEFFHGEKNIDLPFKDFTPADLYDIHTNGVRVFSFVDDVVQLGYDIKNTLTMFLEPMQQAQVSDEAAEHNMYFLRNYQQIQPYMAPRNTTVPDLPADYIQSGDFLGIIRLDGLDPMLGWAMGSTTGHTVLAIRAPNNTLFCCESTVNSSYWPVNGVQCTEYEQWVKQAVNADYQTVVIPLKPELRARFNATKAWNFFQEVHGFDYGYRNLLYGWIDTVKDNYPCIPPDYSSRCLQWELVSTLFAVLDRSIPAVGILFDQAWNLRLGTSGLKAADLYHVANQRGLQSNQLPVLTELDSFIYNTTRFGIPTPGRSQVCCVFVCNMWKAAGLFGDLDFNCAEQTNMDDYTLDLFDLSRMGDNRPEACKIADPDNIACQITGKYTLNLNQMGSRQPYAHMNERCESLAPEYKRTPGC